MNKSCKWTVTAGGVMMVPSLLLTATASTPLAATLLIAVILFGFQISINNVQALPSEFFTGKSIGTLAELGGTSATVGVLITIWLVPMLTKVSYVPFFLLGASLVPLGVLAIFVFAGEIKQVELRKGSV